MHASHASITTLKTYIYLLSQPVNKVRKCGNILAAMQPSHCSAASKLLWAFNNNNWETSYPTGELDPTILSQVHSAYTHYGCR